MNTQTTAQRQLTGQRVSTLLSKAVIAPHGATTLSIVGRGNPFTRENGTEIVIFNVQAFPNIEGAKYASEEWKKGLAKEKANDLDGAQDHYKEALNSMMSFSVLKDNATAFSSVYEINAKVEQVPASKELQDAGTKTVLGINNPRPVAITATGTSAASLFELPADAPATTGGGMAGAGRRARKAATAAK